MRKPLEGVRVLDFTQFFAGPVCTMLLGDMGAEIIKLENPPIGDGTRYSKTIAHEKSTNFTTRNRGKKSVVMNLKDERQKGIFFKMVKEADIVIENFKPGTLEKYGVTYDVLKEINPAIVFTSISGYGQTGPYRGHAAFDGAVQAESGLMSVNGEAGGDPVKCGAAIADATAGLVGCIGTLGALYDARETGIGRRVDVSMMDSMVLIMENLVSSYLASGELPQITGNRHWTAAPFNSFTCKDGKQIYIGISTDAQFVKFCEILGHPEWAEDPRFQVTANRIKNVDLVDQMVGDVLKNMDVNELADKMQENRLVYGHINTVADVTKHPQVLARHMLVNAVYPDGVSFQVPGNPIKMTGIEERDNIETYPLGYNTFEVLKEYEEESVLHEIFDETLDACAKATSAKYRA